MSALAHSLLLDKNKLHSLGGNHGLNVFFTLYFIKGARSFTTKMTVFVKNK